MRSLLAVVVAGVVIVFQSPGAAFQTSPLASRSEAPASTAVTTTFFVTSRDGARRYEVRVVRPPQPAPPAGYPVLYLLDGRSTLPAITPAIRDRAWATVPTAFVAIAHDTTDRAALNAARTLDLTVGPMGTEARPSDPQSGGADVFLDLLVQEIRPKVAALLPIDDAHQAFYGHSYGALCVLHTLFTRSTLFQTYIAASPSFWWGDGYLERALTTAMPSLRAAHARVLLTIGDQEIRRVAGRAPDPTDAARGVATLRAMARTLDDLPAIDASSQVFEGRNHGAALAPSVEEAVRLVSGQKQR